MGESSIYPVTPFPTAVACTLPCYDQPPIFCPDNPIPFYAVLGSRSATDGPFRVNAFDIQNGWVAANVPVEAEQPASDAEIFALAYNKAGTRLAATHRRDGGVTLWNTLDWTLIDVPDLPDSGEAPSFSVPRYGAYNAAETQFLISFTDQQPGPPFTWYYLYNIVGDTWVLEDPANMELLFDSSAVTWQFAYSPDGLWLALPSAGGTAEFKMYKASDYVTLMILESQPDPTNENIGFGAWGAAWHPLLPSRWVAFTGQPTGTNNGDGVYLYEVNQINPNPPNEWPLLNKGSKFVPIAPNVQVYRCAFSPNGQYFAFGSDAAPFIHVYDVSVINNWQPITLQGTAPDQRITDVSFSKDNKWLLACKPDGSIPHAYAYDIENNWALVASDDLNQASLSWYCGQIPEQ